MRPEDASAAIIALDDGRYLLQLRDDKAGIVPPRHRDPFRGDIERDERPVNALRREPGIALALSAAGPCEVCRLPRFEFGLTPANVPHKKREYFDLRREKDTDFEGFGPKQVLALPLPTLYGMLALCFHINH